MSTEMPAPTGGGPPGGPPAPTPAQRLAIALGTADPLPDAGRASGGPAGAAGPESPERG